ncbi:hypothetical protein OESDEN_03627 [Oesophagostomum dentatum]|uniref:CWH43-like N-terminal domain-containing protein n=1 Tax=Oesophagostomum dentatum TaxID=61180 RepID=A0A0B1TJX0_OESDE|nr:hypothetical protein OESDEN_03627 [Oesophagostomum dentatum]
MSKQEKGQEKSPTPPLNARGLFESYEKDGKKITEILRFNAVEVFFAGFLPPLVGSVSAIAIALIFHNDEISNYNWQCGSDTHPQQYVVFLEMHVIFFYVFGFCGIGHMIANIFCHAHSLYYLNPYGRLSYYLKIIFTSLYLLSAPILVGAFLLYWKKCITWAYDVFAICEYCGVFLNICFHGCAFFDIRYKLVPRNLDKPKSLYLNPRLRSERSLLGRRRQKSLKLPKEYQLVYKGEISSKDRKPFLALKVYDPLSRVEAQKLA